MTAPSRLTLVLVAVLPAACRPPVPEQKISGPVTPIAAVAPSLAEGPWLYRPTTQRRAYVIQQNAVLATRVDTFSRNDSVSSRAELAFTLFSGGSQVGGSVTAFSVRGPGQRPATPGGLVLPFTFAGDLRSHTQQIAFTVPIGDTPCASAPMSVLQSLRDLWFRPPDTLRLRTTWEDTASYTVCRDGIVLHTGTWRVFRVAAAAVRDGRVLLTIRRSTRSTLKGAGQQAGEPVEITGTSSGQAAYELDPETGELFGALGTSALELVLKSRLRTQAVLQVNEMRISARSVDKP